MLQKQLMSTKYFLIHTHFAVGEKGLKNAYFYTSLLVPGHDPPQDITIFMDVSLNPGPDLTGGWLLHDRLSTSQVVGRHSHTNSRSLTMKYSRKSLRSLRSSACTPCPQVLGELKSHGVLRYRGGKGGKKTRGNYLPYFLD